MAEIIKLAGVEITLNGTANLVSSAAVVKITNANTTTTSTITIVPASGSNTTTTILASSYLLLQKAPDSKVASSLTSLVTATPIAFT